METNFDFIITSMWRDVCADVPGPSDLMCTVYEYENGDQVVRRGNGFWHTGEDFSPADRITELPWEDVRVKSAVAYELVQLDRTFELLNSRTVG